MPLGIIMQLGRYGDEESCLNGLYHAQGDSAKMVELQQEAGPGRLRAGELVDTRVSWLFAGAYLECLVVFRGSSIARGAGRSL